MVKFGLEVLYEINENYPGILKKYWGEDVIQNPVKWFKSAVSKIKECGEDIISVSFNVEDIGDKEKIENCKRTLAEIVEIAQKSDVVVLLKGSGQKDLDAILLPELIPLLGGHSIVAPVQDNNYKAILPYTLEKNHKVVLRTPIDINLTKELNILSIDKGLKPENILMDPDTGCVGYGLDYGYSIIERICCAGDTDKMLDMPIIVFSGAESFKAKETKSEDFSVSWGTIGTRSINWEISTTMALICAGADIVISWHPETITAIKETLGEGM